LFTAFGESALNFQASFWSALQGRKELECELRHRIAESFVAAGIVMAFPQRDVHLATSAPLRVEVVSPAQCPLPASSPPSPPAATPAK
jgi:small-conductance mechanosensitive channel